MADFLKRIAADRIGGERPTPPRAAGAALVAGTAVAVVTYRLLRA